MSNHKARTWDHIKSKPLNFKLLLLSHHLDASSAILITGVGGEFLLLFFTPDQKAETKKTEKALSLFLD